MISKLPEQGPDLREIGARVLVGGMVCGLLAVYPASLLVTYLSEHGFGLTPALQQVMTFALISGVFLIAAIFITYFVLSAEEMPDDLGEPPTPFSPPETSEGDYMSAPPLTPPDHSEMPALPTAIMPETVTEPTTSETPYTLPAEPNGALSKDHAISVPEPGPAKDIELAPGEYEPGELIDLGFESDYADTGKPSPGITEDHRRAMILFLDRARMVLNCDVAQMNEVMVFGLNLFLGGAAERFGAFIGLKPLQKFVLIRESIGSLTKDPEDIDRFCEKFIDYDIDPRYSVMTRSGREIMEMYLDDNHACFARLPELFEHWVGSPAGRAHADGVVVIMCTDLTDKSRAPDSGIVNTSIVRAHNAAVRKALAEHHGVETKHTGNGIMASFSNAPQAVGAAQMILRGFERHNRETPATPVHLRLGLHVEKQEKFEDNRAAQTIQLSARVCGLATTGQILVTEKTMEYCAEHPITFAEVDDHGLKQSGKPARIFEVAWRREGAP